MNLHDVCRFCLVKSSASSAELFFQVDESLQKKFEDVTDIKLRNSDEFPKKACSSCITDLEQHHYYRNGLIEKQKRLNSLIGVIDDEKHEQIEITRNVKVDPEPTTTISILKCEEPQEINFIDEDHQQLEEEEVDYFEEGEFEDEMGVDEEALNDEEEIYEETTLEQGELDTSAQHAVEMEEYEFVEQQVEYEEDLVETIELEESSPPPASSSARRKYTKKPKESQVFVCWDKDCKHRSSFRSAMKRHLLQAHDLEISNSTCLLCRKSFELYSEYLSHIKSHTRKSQCEICMMTFLNDEKVAIHMRRVHKSETEDQRNFECEICQARFKRQEHVTSHMTYKHSDPSDRKFQCSKCPSAFLRRSDLRTHEKGHENVMMQCIYCDYSRRDLKSLRRHTLKAHSSTKLYKCTACNEEFDAHRELQTHRKQCLGPSVIDSSTEMHAY